MRRRPSRLVLFPALLAGVGASFCAATSAPAQEAEERPEYRSNRPYGQADDRPRAAASVAAEDDAPVYRSNRPYASDIAAADPKDSPWGVTGGVDVRDNYFFRGYNLAPGLNVQPYFDVLYTVYQKGEFAVTPHIGTWLNFTEDQGTEDPTHWGEVDLNLGVAVDWGDFTFDFQYFFYDSPNNTFLQSEEIGVDVTYDDSRFWKTGPIAALNPSVAFFHEFHDRNDDESDAYVGLGLEPELRSFDLGRVPVTVSFPLTLGGSYNGYYFNSDNEVDQLGFWSAGVKFGFDLPQPENSPRWRVEAEATYIRLMADSVENANGGDRDDIAIRAGLTFEL